MDGACFNANILQPRYVVTSDVDKVLDYIHRLGDNSTFKQVLDPLAEHAATKLLRRLVDPHT